MCTASQFGFRWTIFLQMYRLLFIWFVKQGKVNKKYLKQTGKNSVWWQTTVFSDKVQVAPLDYPEAKRPLFVRKATQSWKWKPELKFIFYFVFSSQFYLYYIFQSLVLTFSLISSFCQNITLRVADQSHTVLLKSTLKEDANRRPEG